MSASYGGRGKLEGFDSGVRRVAPSFGKQLFLTYSEKADGTLVVESDSERFVAHMLTLDPNVSSFTTQPFTVDLIDRRICRTQADVEEARARHRRLRGKKFYTPDFSVRWHLGGHVMTAVEVKLEGYEGNSDDMQRISIGRNIIESAGIEFLRIIWPKAQRNPLKANLPILVKALRRVDLWPSAEMVQAVESALESGVSTVRELCGALSLSPNLVPTLLVSGLIRGNVRDELINGTMRIEPAYGDLGSLSLLRSLVQ
ncbi:hypothetical protein [Alcaligenes phenolicus]|uniref:TnsA endonuclease N-terminal domain-containing protein n=1 Tax=Alcaligenes phenolicus TaxID=232846 RepID=A0AAW5VXR3_9BURK|nr:hypothetical protein [Alcaligenes phenolicus]MCX5565666.1 hypothetical protein [Alcaligenes phenolicus]